MAVAIELRNLASVLMVRKKLVVGNWKMNGSLTGNAALLAELGGCDMAGRVEVVICPPYPYLFQVRDMLAGTGLAVGAQNLSSFKDGAYTGEVSASMLVDLGCSWVIVGHSERRGALGDTDNVIAAKVRAALEAGLKPILCVGETLAQREAGEAEIVVRSQLDGVILSLGSEGVGCLVVAYEPVWAIGTGKTATPEEAEAMHVFIRSCLVQCGMPAHQTRVLYGGSVAAANATALFGMPNIDGALVGGASLVAKSFSSICVAAAEF